MKILDSFAPVAHWGLRLSIAATFLYHGIGKIKVNEFAASFDLPVPVVIAVMVAEIVAALCLIIGAFGREILTRLAGLIVIGVMAGAISMVHFKNGFSFANNGFEFQLLVLLTGLYFAARGNKV